MQQEINPSDNDTIEFERLLEQTMSTDKRLDKRLVEGIVLAIDKDNVIIDVGLKSEGVVPVREFREDVGGKIPAVGDKVDVFIDHFENSKGQIAISREQARIAKQWDLIEQRSTDREWVQGSISKAVKGGFSVNLNGVLAFLPKSQVDMRSIPESEDAEPTIVDFAILKIDRGTNNVVVSRRVVLDEGRAEEKAQLLEVINEGDDIEGIVKNIADYGAFIDLGAIDGLLHVTDMAWKRISHPSEVLKLGEKVKVKIIKINKETQRISLGLKQFLDDPWKVATSTYKIGDQIDGRITNVTDYGAFVEIDDGVEGLVHVSEMAWNRSHRSPNKLVSVDEVVRVQVLEIDADRRRISLGIKQTQESPWEAFAAKTAVGEIITGEIRNKTEFGLFLKLDGDIDGMVHMSDLDWNLPGDKALKLYEAGQEISAKVLDIAASKGRISLGVKQLSSDPMSKLQGFKVGEVVTCQVTEISSNGIEVTIGDSDVTSFIHRSALSREHSEQQPERFAVGQKVDAKVTNIDSRNRSISVSIKSLEISQEKEAVEKYGSKDSGASLGAILVAAMSSQSESQNGSTPDTSAEDTVAAPKAKSKKAKVEKLEGEKPEGESEAKPEDAKVDAKVDAEPDAKVDAEPDSEQSEAKAEVESKVETKVEPKVEPKTTAAEKSSGKTTAKAKEDSSVKAEDPKIEDTKAEETTAEETTAEPSADAASPTEAEASAEAEADAETKSDS